MMRLLIFTLSFLFLVGASAQLPGSNPSQARSNAPAGATEAGIVIAQAPGSSPAPANCCAGHADNSDINDSTNPQAGGPQVPVSNRPNGTAQDRDP